MNGLPILYAEDEENDAFFLTRAFSQAGITNSLIIVRDGQEAVDYLSTAERDSEKNSLPGLVLLDLNMPKKSGLEVLKWIRHQPSLSTLPVIILTSSLQDADIHRAYLLGANAYLVKPSNPEELITLSRALKDFWLLQNRATDNKLPAIHGGPLQGA